MSQAALGLDRETAREALIKYHKFSFDASTVRRWFRLLGKS